jgi:hypothetical protein
MKFATFMGTGLTEPTIKISPMPGMTLCQMVVDGAAAGTLIYMPFDGACFSVRESITEVEDKLLDAAHTNAFGGAGK